MEEKNLNSYKSANNFQEIVNWFLKEHGEFVFNGGLVSWAGKLGIALNKYDEIDEGELFQLFVLAALWNNPPTFHAEKGVEVFQAIKQQYTLDRFRRAETEVELKGELRKIATEKIGNSDIFGLLMYVANGKSEKGEIWLEIKRILDRPHIGEQEEDVDRLLQLHRVFNPRQYAGEAYLTVKVFLIFRELRIQFKELGRYQYHPAVCCIPDSHVRCALQEMELIVQNHTDIESLIRASKIVAENFCNQTYELYDLPLFFAHKENYLRKITEQKAGFANSQREHAGKCPSCGAPLVWRKAQKTGESYRGCTNFDGGCRWQDRSY
jgi:hypothetical protein